MSLYWKLLIYIKPYIPSAVLAMICLLGASGAQLILPWVIKNVIDDVLINKDMAMLNLISVSVLVIYFMRGIFGYFQQYLLEYVAQKVVYDLRNQLFTSTLRLRGLAFYEKNRTGGLMSYFTNDIGALQGAIIGPGMEFIRESVILIVSLGMMLYLHAKLTLFLFVSVPLVVFTVKKLGKRIKRMGGLVLNQLNEFTAVLQETLSGIRVVKSFAREDYEIDRFNHYLSQNLNVILKATRANAILTPVVEFLATIGVVLLIWYGGREVINERLTAGALVAFLIYAINLSNPIKRLARLYGYLQQVLAACERVFSMMEFEPEVKDAPEASPIPPIKGEVDFENISFSYGPDSPEVIKEVSFTAKPGQMIALVGHSGAGKTTLANLIMRFYDVTGGAIKIDGLDIREVTQKSLREQIGIVPQETILFSGSILENIRYGSLKASDEEIIKAAQAAHVAEFADQLPTGYDTLVGERGMSLSGGQRQRVAIARAILKNPRILILDEATSALDTESERLVQDALDALLANRTSFVIAHRLSTIFKADVILVFDHGRLVEYGPHQQLLNANGLYARLYHTQFRDEENQALDEPESIPASE